jgi:type VI secretion system secreted protein Hcp
MAANLFVWIQGVTGDATEENHKLWIPVKSVGWSVERAVDLSDLGSTQRGFANVNFGKLAVSAELHDASVRLMELASTGVVREMMVDQLRVTETAGIAAEWYLRWRLHAGQVTKWELSSSEDSVPEETWELAYRKISLEHRLINAETMQLKPGSPAKFGWNLETGKYDDFQLTPEPSPLPAP